MNEARWHELQIIAKGETFVRIESFECWLRRGEWIEVNNQRFRIESVIRRPLYYHLHPIILLGYSAEPPGDGWTKKA